MKYFIKKVKKYIANFFFNISLCNNFSKLLHNFIKEYQFITKKQRSFIFYLKFLCLIEKFLIFKYNRN